MKHFSVILLGIFTCASLTLQAQENYRGVSFIVKAAPVVSKLSTRPGQPSNGEVDVHAATKTPLGFGYNVGLGADIRLSQRLYGYVELRKSAWDMSIHFDDDVYIASLREKNRYLEVIPVCAKYLFQKKKIDFFIAAGVGLTTMTYTSIHYEQYEKYYPQDFDDYNFDGPATYRLPGSQFFFALSAGSNLKLNRHLEIFNSLEYDRNLANGVTKLRMEEAAANHRLVQVVCPYNLFALNLGLKYNLIKK